MTRSRTAKIPTIGLLLMPLASAPGLAQEQQPPESFDEELVVRETSVVALPPAGSELPAAEAVSLTVDGLAQRVTRVEPVLEGERGDWHLVVYLDPMLAGARTRYLSALALGQRAEALAALGTVEVLVADVAKPALPRTESWQRIEAALLSHALESRHRLARGDAPVERPGWTAFGERLDLLLAALEGRGESGPRALLLPCDGLFSVAGREELERFARALAGAGWVVVAMPWTEEPAPGSAARLNEFESWKQSAEGRDTSAGTRRYVIDLGRVFRQLRSGGAGPRAESRELEPELVGLAALAGPTSGMLAARDAELTAALSSLARRWRIWFQTGVTDAAEPRALAVQLDGEALDAPSWFLPPRGD